MSDVFTRLGQRALGRIATVRPPTLPRFASVSADHPRRSADLPTASFAASPVREEAISIPRSEADRPPPRREGPTGASEHPSSSDAVPASPEPIVAPALGTPSPRPGPGPETETARRATRRQGDLPQHPAPLNETVSAPESETPGPDPAPAQQDRFAADPGGLTTVRSRPRRRREAPDIQTPSAQAPEGPERNTESELLARSVSRPRTVEATPIGSATRVEGEEVVNAPSNVPQVMSQASAGPTSAQLLGGDGAFAAEAPGSEPRRDVGSAHIALGTPQVTATANLLPSESTTFEAFSAREAARPDALADAAEPEPSITVHIGRVEVQASAPEPALSAPASTTRREPILSLSDYLRQRDEGTR